MRRVMAITCIVICIFMYAGSAGAVDNNLIPLWMGAWQTVCGMVLGLMGWYIIVFDRQRAARRIHRHRGL